MIYIVLILSLFCGCACFCATQDEIVAAVIIAEAGGEGESGMRAVANVIHNRSKQLNKTPFEIVTQPKQFSCLNKTRFFTSFVNNNKKHTNWNYACFLATELNNGILIDITGGATHYHSISVCPLWASKLQKTCHIGRHVFYK